MKNNQSKEDYLETILVLNNRINNVRSIDVVNELGFKKSSVSVAMKKLKEDGCVYFDDNSFIHLTEKGLAIASKIYERHLYLTRFFESVGVSSKQAQIDACNIEHDISEETFSCIKEYFSEFKK